MKVASVTYTGRMGRHHRQVKATGNRFTWRRNADGSVSSVTVEDIEDALYFESRNAFDVEWTPLGRLAKSAEGPVDDIQSSLSDMSYRAKQEIAKALGLKASGKEEEIEERIRPEIERLQQQMEEL